MVNATMTWRHGVLSLLVAAPAAAFMPALAPAIPLAPRPLLKSRASIESRIHSADPDRRAARAYRAVAGFLDRRYFLVGAASAVAMAAIAPTIGCTGGLLR